MIIESTGENFENHWGFVNYKNKRILDIGADFGSTTRCFLQYEASKIYAIEGDDNYYNMLLARIERGELPKDKVVPIKKMIVSSQDFIYLFSNCDCEGDIIKIDIEGAEIHLYDVPDELLRRTCPEYMVESHNHDIKNKILNKFKNAGFDVRLERSLTADIDVLYLVWNH